MVESSSTPGLFQDSGRCFCLDPAPVAALMKVLESLWLHGHKQNFVGLPPTICLPFTQQALLAFALRKGFHQYANSSQFFSNTGLMGLICYRCTWKLPETVCQSCWSCISRQEVKSNVVRKSVYIMHAQTEKHKLFGVSLTFICSVLIKHCFREQSPAHPK